MAETIHVEGLAELRRALKHLEQGEDLVELRDGMKDAARIVATDARFRAAGFSGKAAATIRPLASGNRAYVAGGKASLPWYGWADFGSRNPKTGNPRSRGPWAGSGKGPRGGRFIYPAIVAKSQQVVNRVAQALDQAFRKGGF